MSYSKDIYKEAFAILAGNRQNAKLVSDQRKQALFESVPELKQLENEQNTLGLNISRAVISDPDNGARIVESFKQRSEDIIGRKNEIFKNLNLPSNYLDPPYNCPACEDTGYVDGKQCICLRDSLKKLAYDKLNSLSNLHLSSFHNFDIKYYPSIPDKKTGIIPQVKMGEIFEYCLKYANTFSVASRNILMCGETGLGKTHLSLSIAKIAIDKGYNVIYVSIPNIIGTLESEKFGRVAIEESGDSLTLLLECELLILDDLGTEFQTQFTSSMVYNIINTRIIKHLPTIINTNLDHTKLENAYSPRIVSRIAGNYDTLLFLGNDIRPILKKKSVEV